jgi:VanZ family protein
MSKKKAGLILFIVLLIWVGVIFYFSSQPPAASYSQSKMAIKIIYKINDLFDISQTRFYERISTLVKDNWPFGFEGSTNMIVRKSAHFGIYFLLGIVSASFSYVYSRKKLTSFLLGVSLPVTVAVLDEYNQGLVGRSSSLNDVIIDGAGAFTGSLLTIIFIVIFGLTSGFFSRNRY